MNSQSRALHARVLLWERCDLNLYSEAAPDHCWCRTSVITFILCSASVVSLVMTFPVTFHQCSFTGILKKETKPTQMSKNLSLHWHPPATRDGLSSGKALITEWLCRAHPALCQAWEHKTVKKAKSAPPGAPGADIKWMEVLWSVLPRNAVYTKPSPCLYTRSVKCTHKPRVA